MLGAKQVAALHSAWSKGTLAEKSKAATKWEKQRLPLKSEKEQVLDIKRSRSNLSGEPISFTSVWRFLLCKRRSLIESQSRVRNSAEWKLRGKGEWMGFGCRHSSQPAQTNRQLLKTLLFFDVSCQYPISKPLTNLFPVNYLWLPYKSILFQ